MKSIKIKVENLSVTANLYASHTAEALWEALPFEGRVNVWGEEIYFDISPMLAPEFTAREIVDEGELGYWPNGPALCIFFGPTPVSTDEKPRAYSPVNVFGKVEGDPKVFKTVSGGATIRIEKLE